MIYSLISISVSSQQPIVEQDSEDNFKNLFDKLCDNFLFEIDNNQDFKINNMDILCFYLQTLSKDIKYKIKHQKESQTKRYIENFIDTKIKNIIKLLEGFSNNYNEYTSNLKKYKDKTTLDYLLDNNKEKFFQIFDNIGFNNREEFDKLSKEEKNRLKTHNLQFIYDFFCFLQQKQENNNLKGSLKYYFHLNFKDHFLKSFLSKEENLQELEKRLGKELSQKCLQEVKNENNINNNKDDNKQ